MQLRVRMNELCGTVARWLSPTAATMKQKHVGIYNFQINKVDCGANATMKINGRAKEICRFI